MRRAPSFSSRPGFPNGLRVLLVEGDRRSVAKAEAQCKGLSYTVTSAVGCQEALSALSSGSFDVVLAEARVLLTGCGQRGSEREKLMKLIKDMKELPFILMSESPKADEVMLGIKLGAAEFLEKPLCPLKLKNIWQHTVRRMMRGDTEGTRRSSQELSVCNNSSNNNDGVVMGDAQLVQHSFPNNLGGSPCAGSPALIDLSTACSSSPGQVNDLLADSRPCSATGAAGEQERRCSKRRAARETSTVRFNTAPNAGAGGKQHGCSGSSSAAQMSLPAGPMAMATPAAPVQLAPPVCAPGMPWAVPQLPLPAGMAWGMPMNPMAVAPGITPPIFPAPASPPMAMQAWCMPPMGLPGMQPGMFPPMPGMPPCGPMHMMAPEMCGPAVGFAGACGPTGQLPPLPMHMLADACKGPGFGKCNMSAGSPSCKSGSDVLGLDPEDAAFLEAFDTKLPRCESNLLLPSLEDLIADTDIDVDMDAALQPLGCHPLKKSGSITDMLSEALVAM